MTFTVAILGRPNVGKSTLFNRLVGRRLALVDDAPGVTRDRREGEAKLGDLSFTVVDTAGLENVKGEDLTARMQRQTELAIEAADVCLFMIDARAGVTPLDRHFAEILRKADTPVILAANKCEGLAGTDGVYDAFSLGLGEPIGLSAEHAEGMGELYSALHAAARPFIAEYDEFDREDDALPDDKPLKLAVVGRPNVGKSTLINRLLGEDRLLTGPEAGITRDSISVDWQWQNRRIKLFDTAGVRRRAKVTDKLEKLSVADSLRAIRFAEVVVLLMDATQPLEKQDLQITDLVVEEGRALVIGLNKWDLVEDPSETAKELRLEIERLLPQIRGVPFIMVSAATGKGLEKLMPAVETVRRDWSARVKTPELNHWLKEMTERHPPPAVSGRRIRLRYMAQIKTRPPTFVVMATRAAKLPESYKRYLINGLRDAFDLAGTPIRLNVRQGKNPYVSSGDS